MTLKYEINMKNIIMVNPVTNNEPPYLSENPASLYNESNDLNIFAIPILCLENIKVIIYLRSATISGVSS